MEEPHIPQLAAAAVGPRTAAGTSSSAQRTLYLVPISTSMQAVGCAGAMAHVHGDELAEGCFNSVLRSERARRARDEAGSGQCTGCIHTPYRRTSPSTYIDNMRGTAPIHALVRTLLL